MAIFNPFLPSFAKNPYPAYASLRASEPVHFSPTLQAWIVTSFADCERVLREPETFANNPLLATSPMARQFQQQRREFPLGEVPTVLNSDAPVHTRLRGIVSRAFTPRVIEGMRERIEEITSELLDAAPVGEPWDLVEGLALPLPVIVIAELLGVPASDRELFKRWSTAIADTATNVFSTPESVESTKRASADLIEYLGRVVEERRRSPREDVITALVQAEDEGSHLTRDELLAFTVVLLIAGHETTINLIGNGTLALLDEPEQARLLHEHPELIGEAVEEFLRFDSPVQGLVRVATRDVEVGGRAVHRGDALIVMIGAANRDPAHFVEPDRLDVRREDKRHLAFGLGPHFCLGAPLARLEAQVAFRALLTRFASLELAAPAERGGTFVLRGLRTLPVRVN
ncbi:MAG: cytochrome P450 [Dehalococcoidia bacterium]